ncbi:hypothetical protein GOB25_19115 [Sinorhizobium meliloti]|nr:hypothetical protein [Sinorhizobium meliloti]
MAAAVTWGASIPALAGGVVATAATPAGSLVEGGTLVLEASSAHLSIQLYWDDSERQRTSFRYLTILPLAIDKEQVLWRVLVDEEQGVSKIAARGEAEASWEAKAGSPGSATPEPALQYAITVAPEEVPIIIDTMKSLIKGNQVDRSLSGYANFGVAALTRVLRDAAFKQQVASDQIVELFPNPNDYGATPLAWLYGLMQRNSGGPGGQLDGCRTREGHFLSPKDLAGGFLDRLGPALGTTTTRVLGIVKLYDDLRRYVDDHDVEADLLPFLQFDPVLVDIYNCQMLQAMRGNDGMPESVVGRSQIYRAFDDYLTEANVPEDRRSKSFPGGEPPRFFRAAYLVTRPLGVAFVDMLERDPESLLNQVWVPLFDVGQFVGVITLTEDADLPSQLARKVLRDINVELFKLNRTIMRRLFARSGRLFDPLDTDNPAMKGYSKATAFDLRMVIAEQTTIERYLLADGLKSNSVLMRQLTTYSRILPALNMERVFGPGRGKSWEHLERIRDVYAAVAKAGIESDFADFRYRVAIGSSYVFILHGLDPSTELTPYLNILWPTLRARPTDAEARALDEQVRALRDGDDVLAPADGNKSAAARLQRGVLAYLSPTAANDLWLDCSSGIDVLAKPTAPQSQAGSIKARLGFLAAHGPGAAVAAFELLPQAGAIDGAARPPTLLSESACASIHARRVALECALTTASPDGCKKEFARSVRTPGNNGADTVFLIEESIATKAYAAQLGAFFSSEVSAGTPPDRIVEAARQKANAYARNVAIFSALNAASERALANYGPGIAPEDLAPARALLGSKTGTVGVQADSEFTVDPAALERLNGELASLRLPATIEQRRAALAPIIAKLDAYYSPNAPIVLPGMSDEPVASAETSVTEEILPLAPAKLTETVVNLESGLAEAGVELQVVPTGNSAAGIPLYDVGVAYRMPLSGGAAGCELATAFPCVGGAEEIVPLGIKVHRVAKTARGGLQTTALLGEQDTDLDGAVAAAALHRLGLPSIFEVQGLGIDGSPDFSSLTLSFGFDVGGFSDSGLELPILRDGAAVDIRGALEAEVRKRIEAIDMAGRLDSLRLPAFGRRGKGLWLAPDPSGASVSLDWAGQALVANIGYRLGYGAEDAPQISAKAELLATTRGFEARQMTFSGEEAGAFTRRLLNETGLGAALAGKLDDLSVVPEYADSELALAVSGNFTIENCTVAIVVRVAADELVQLDTVVNRILASGEQTARDIANCVVHKALDSVQQFLANKSLKLFGLTLAIDNAEALADDYAVNPAIGELWPVLKLEDTTKCELPGPASGSITGAVIHLADSNPRIDLSGIARNEAESTLLGRAVECRLRSLIAPGGTIDFQDYQISGDVYSVVVTIRNLPWLGDISLGRINLSAFGTEDPQKILTDAVGAALEARIGEEIAHRLAGQVTMPGIGDFELLADGTRVVLFGADARIELRGQVDIQGINASATLTIPFKGLPGSARVNLELGQTLQDSILGAIADLLPFGGEQVQVSAPKLVRLDANGRRFGLVFGVTANFAMDPSPGFKVEIRRIIVTDEDIRLGGQIRLRLGYDLEFVYFAITDITVIYDTGEGGGHKGVMLQASVAPLASILKYIIKLEGELDLRELGSKRFTLNAALILLSSLDLMLATGTIDLDKTAITFEAKTSPAVAEVLDVHGSGKLLGEQGLASADAVMGILGVKLSETEMLACSKPCDGLPSPEMLRVRVHQNLLIGEASLLGTTDFELNNPQIGGRVDLDLLGWRPASATLDASLTSVVASLRFIGIGITVITPSIKTMTPELLIDILKSLLDIDLESLLKMKLKDITVSLMHGDGSVTTYQPSSPDGPDGGQKPGGEARNEAPNPATTDPKQYNASAPDLGDAPQQTEPQFPGVNELFGDDKVEAIYCEKVFGTGASWPANDGDRFEFWIYETRDQAPRLYSGHTHEDPSQVTWHNWTFDATSAREICSTAVHKVHELDWQTFPRVGVGRQISTDYDECTDNVPSIGLWGLVGADVGVRAKYVTSYKPVLCWEKGGERYDLRVRLLRGDQYLGLVECVAPLVAPQWLEEDPLFKRACRERSGLLRLGQLDDVKDGLLTASQEFALLDIRARHLLTTGQGQYPELKLSFEVPMAAGAINVTVYPVYDRNGVETGSRILIQGPDGKTLTATLPTGDPLNDWLREQGFQQEIIAHWFERGRRPSVAFRKNRTDLVLADGGSARTWLFRDDPAQTVIRRDLIIEETEGDEALEDFLPALAQEVRLLGEGSWHASQGVAKQSNIRLFVLRHDVDQKIRVLLDLYLEPSGPDREPGDFSTTERKLRRHCASISVFGAAMRDRLGPAVAGRTLLQILAAPDDVLSLGPLVHPLIVVREQPACAL